MADTQLKFSRLRSGEEVKDNMQITIETEAGKEGEGSKRKVARDVDMENFTVVDEVCFCPSRQLFRKLLFSDWRGGGLQS